MVDFGSIAAAVSGLKTAADIAKGMLDLKTAADVQGKVIDLQSVILNAQSSALAAQSEQMSLLQRIGELEQQVARNEGWETEAKRYQLRDYGKGRFAYELKKEDASGEPLHRLCEKCFQQRRKSILHFKFRQNDSGTDYYGCFACASEFRL
jgi:hypothetical protein